MLGAGGRGNALDQGWDVVGNVDLQGVGVGWPGGDVTWDSRLSPAVAH